MAQAEPGAIARGAARRRRRSAPEPFDAIFADLDALILPGLSHWQHPGFFGYFPANGELSSVLGDYPQHRPRRARPLLAVEPGADRARGGRHRLDAPDGRPVRRLERRHPGHRLDQHAGRAALRARADDRLLRWRAAGLQAATRRSSSTPRRHATARWTRPRCSPASGATTSADRRARRGLRDAPRRARGGDPRRSRAPGATPCAVVATTGTTDDDGARSDRRDRRRSPQRTGSGCTSTPRWPARR